MGVPSIVVTKGFVNPPFSNSCADTFRTGVAPPDPDLELSHLKYTKDTFGGGVKIKVIELPRRRGLLCLVEGREVGRQGGGPGGDGVGHEPGIDHRSCGFPNEVVLKKVGIFVQECFDFRELWAENIFLVCILYFVFCILYSVYCILYSV